MYYITYYRQSNKSQKISTASNRSDSDFPDRSQTFDIKKQTPSSYISTRNFQRVDYNSFH